MIRKSSLGAAVIAGIALVGCARAIDVSDKPVARFIVGRCLATREPLFLIARTSPKQKFTEQTGILIRTLVRSANQRDFESDYPN